MRGLKRILERLGLKQTELAGLLDVSPRAVSLWATGAVALPGPVQAYLRLLQSVSPSLRAAEFARLARAPDLLDDGLYSLSYGQSVACGGDGGDALAVLRSGRIVGSDRWGGKFEGTCRFDTARKTNHVHVRLHVPPEGELVTGFCAGATGASVEVTAELARNGPLAATAVDVAGQRVDLTLAYLGPLPG